jgi:hypothetical protein
MTIRRSSFTTGNKGQTCFFSAATDVSARKIATAVASGERELHPVRAFLG